MHEFDVPVYDIVINKGADFVLDIELDDDNNSATPFDMSQYNFVLRLLRMKIHLSLVLPLIRVSLTLG